MKEHCQKVYAAIDLKSFYASVECFQRNLDPLDAMPVSYTHLTLPTT